MTLFSGKFQWYLEKSELFFYRAAAGLRKLSSIPFYIVLGTWKNAWLSPYTEAIGEAPCEGSASSHRVLDVES